MNGHARHWNLKHRQVDLVHVLRRPVEIATEIERSDTIYDSVTYCTRD